ncbi:conserved hypothetical protein [Trichinella spiralis]|uniref:hypothetical protein n=1 Tax=Trichinella spiralis TaxID=6334 RepID=UPI0001EFE5BE|nr:conserved hypothetical protein [Trichinella spiralis]
MPLSRYSEHLRRRFGWSCWKQLAVALLRFTDSKKCSTNLAITFGYSYDTVLGCLMQPPLFCCTQSDLLVFLDSLPPAPNDDSSSWQHSGNLYFSAIPRSSLSAPAVPLLYDLEVPVGNLRCKPVLLLFH